MRLELEFKLQEKLFISDFRGIFISYIKKALTEFSQGRFYESYFGDTRQKDYTFTVIFGKPQYHGDEIQLSHNHIKMIFSADDRNKTGLIFFNAFILQKNKSFPLPKENSMTLKSIIQKQEHKIVYPKVIFKMNTGGGLCVREHCKETNRNTHYVFHDEGFHNQMKDVLRLQAKNAGFSDSVAANIDMKPIQCKKVVAKHYGCYIDLTIGMFEMMADVELLQYFYQAGIGSRHSAGFGMVDLVTQDLL